MRSSTRVLLISTGDRMIRRRRQEHPECAYLHEESGWVDGW
jgi:hypothetical protein